MEIMICACGRMRGNIELLGMRQKRWYTMTIENGRKTRYGSL